MDPMEVDTTQTKRPAPPTKRVSFEVPPRAEDPKRLRASPPAQSPIPTPPVQSPSTTTSPNTPPPPSLSLLASIFLPFHAVPTPPPSSPLTREATLVQTIENLAAQKKATKRLQVHLVLQERDRIIAAERAAKARAAAEKGEGELSRDVTKEEMDAIQSRLVARPDPKKENKEFEYRGGEWIRDPAERERWKQVKGEELGHGVAEKLLGLTAEAAVKMKVYELQSNSMVEGKKRALENERKRIAALEGTGEEGSGATRLG